MELDLKISYVDEKTIKIIDKFDLSPWMYTVIIGGKYMNVFIDNDIITLNNNIKWYFELIELHNENPLNVDNQQVPMMKVTLDLNEFKKLKKIDSIKPGSGIIAPTMPDDSERIQKLETDLGMKQRQLLMLSSKLDNLENLLKRSLGL